MCDFEIFDFSRMMGWSVDDLKWPSWDTSRSIPEPANFWWVNFSWYFFSMIRKIYFFFTKHKNLVFTLNKTVLGVRNRLGPYIQDPWFRVSPLSTQHQKVRMVGDSLVITTDPARSEWIWSDTSCFRVPADGRGMFSENKGLRTDVF